MHRNGAVPLGVILTHCSLDVTFFGMRLPQPVIVVLVLGACAPAATRQRSAPATDSAPTPAASLSGAGARATTRPATPDVPPVPLVLGPLVPKVVYPLPDQLIQSRDSNFIFGSVGNGRAHLSIDDTPVKVLANGSFLAFLPNPSSARPSYDLVATLGADTVRLSQPVRLLPPVQTLPLSGPLVVDSASVTPAGRLGLSDDETVRVSVRAPANAVVEWWGDSGVRVRLVGGSTLPDSLTPGGLVGAGVPARYAIAPERWASEIAAARMRSSTSLVISRGTDTVRLALPAVEAPPRVGMWAMLGADSVAQSDTDRVITARPLPGGTYRWLLMPGTMVPVTGWSGRFVRVRLDEALDAWVNASDARLLPSGWTPQRRIAANARVVPADDWVDFRIPLVSRPPFLVEEGDHSITLTLYGVTANTDIINYASNDSLVKEVSWQQVSSGRARYTLRLTAQPYGYLAFWDDGSFVLRVRRPPLVHRDRPLEGLTIAVDPGHPPVGATGPTGLYEGDAVLAVGEKVRAMLLKRGARVVMTRTTAGPVPLGDRPIMARRADANALVSIHLNALPDGVNPFRAHGTGAYFFHPQSEPLARSLQNGMLDRMGLPNLGVNYDNLALARPTWMPAVLCEGAFIIIPEQEAALRTSEFQTAYALGIVDGLEDYFRSLASAR
ncbi:MAG TPA: N-acetylmuramoyl-L-alanine amidase [Gemmatimonadaceae bacterium]